MSMAKRDFDAERTRAATAPLSPEDERTIRAALRQQLDDGTPETLRILADAPLPELLAMARARPVPAPENLPVPAASTGAALPVRQEEEITRRELLVAIRKDRGDDAANALTPCSLHEIRAAECARNTGGGKEMFLKPPPSELSKIYNRTISPEFINAAVKKAKGAKKAASIFGLLSLAGIGGAVIGTEMAALLSGAVGFGFVCMLVAAAAALLARDESDRVARLRSANEGALQDARAIAAQIDAIEAVRALPAPAPRAPTG